MVTAARAPRQQMQNYSKKKELEVRRLDMFDEGIVLYNKGDYDGALIVFEVAALEPKNFMSDNFEMSARSTRWRSTTSRAASASSAS